MKNSLCSMTLSVLAAGTVALHGNVAQALKPPTSEPRYVPKGEILFGGQGGWDYVSIDPSSHRLFLSHVNKVVVVDTESQKVIGEIPDTLGVHGVAIAADLDKGFSSNGRENEVSVIDLKSLKLRSKIAVGEGPDSIVYAASTKEIYVFNGKSNSVSVLSAVNDKLVVTIALPGKPEFAVADKESNRIFVNIEDKNSLVALDLSTHKIAANWILPGCEGPGGMAQDSKNHRLFIACDNQKMLMLDSGDGKILVTIPIGEGTDAVVYDSQLQLAYASNGKDGTVTIAQQLSPNELVVVQTLKTRVGARTIAIDDKSHQIFLPTAKFEPAKKGERAKPIDGSQTVLVYGLEK